MARRTHDGNGPQLLASIDLTHLNLGQRIGLVGDGRWRARQQRLRDLLGTAAVCLVPLGCGGEDNAPADTNGLAGSAGTPGTAGAPGAAGRQGGPGGEAGAGEEAGGREQTSAAGQAGGGTETPEGGGGSGGKGSAAASGAPGGGAGGAEEPAVNDRLAPTVEGADPIPDSTVSRHPQHIRIVFSEPMDTTTLADAITLTPAVPFEVNIDETGTRVDVTGPDAVPLELDPSTTYTLTVAPTALDRAGNALDGNRDGKGGDAFELSVTTQGPPRVQSTWPSDGATDWFMGPAATAEITFDVEMDPDTVSVEVEQNTLGPYIPLGMTPDVVGWQDNRTLVLSGGMDGDTEYTITLPGTARSQDGQALDGNGDGTGGDAYTFTFTTGEDLACACQDYSSSCSCESVSCSLDYPLCPTDSMCTTYGCLCEVQCACQLYQV
jgi:hypothetical protein